MDFGRRLLVPEKLLFFFPMEGTDEKKKVQLQFNDTVYCYIWTEQEKISIGESIAQFWMRIRYERNRWHKRTNKFIKKKNVQYNYQTA